MQKNIQLNYLYRDASNYKKWDSVVFANPDTLPLSGISARLSILFGNDKLFIADQLRLPEVFLYNDGIVTIDDHCFHEFDSVSETDAEVDDVYGRTIDQFIREVEEQETIGWKVFDPAEMAIRGRLRRGAIHLSG